MKQILRVATATTIELERMTNTRKMEIEQHG